MEALLKLADGFDRFSSWVGRMVGWLMLPLIFTIMFDVITRKIDATRLYFAEWTAQGFYSVSTILQDLQWHYHAIILMLTFGFGYIANAHVRVDIFREQMGRRTQGWMEFWMLIIMAIPFLLVLLSFSWDLMSLAYHQGEGSESMTGINQRWIIKNVMWVGFAILFIAVLATLSRLWVMLKGSGEISERAARSLSIFPNDEELAEARRIAEELIRKEAEAAKNKNTSMGA